MKNTRTWKESFINTLLSAILIVPFIAVFLLVYSCKELDHRNNLELVREAKKVETNDK